MVLDENYKFKQSIPAKDIMLGCDDCGINSNEWEDKEIPMTDIYF